MMQIFDSSLLIAAGASFVAGVIGYIIARFWVKPIIRYMVFKKKIQRDLSNYRMVIDGGERSQLPSSVAPAGNKLLKNAKKNAMELTTCYTEEIPYWYRLLLDSKGESPPEAFGLLTNLAKIKDNRQVIKRIDQANEKLRI